MRWLVHLGLIKMNSLVRMYDFPTVDTVALTSGRILLIRMVVQSFVMVKKKSIDAAFVIC